MKKVLLIVPAFNEEGSILKTIENIEQFRPKGEYQLDYIVINDGSTDSTEYLCKTYGIPHITLIQNLGIGGAVQCGYQYAAEVGYDIAVQFDGDGQHDISYLDALLTPILSGKADFTVGSRFLDKTSSFRSTRLRRMGIQYLSFIMRLVSGIKISDPTSGYRAASKKTYLFLSKYYSVDYPEPESLILLQCQGYTIKEVPVNMYERTAGKSSINIKNSAYYMLKVSLAIICAWIYGGDSVQ